MAHVIQITSYANGNPSQYDLNYIKTFDIDDRGGRGVIETTWEIDEAKKFLSALDAFEFYQEQGTIKPIKPNGQPNRPLMVFSIDIINLNNLNKLM